jgi:hypothetical protein
MRAFCKNDVTLNGGKRLGWGRMVCSCCCCCCCCAVVAGIVTDVVVSKATSKTQSIYNLLSKEMVFILICNQSSVTTSKEDDVFFAFV